MSDRETNRHHSSYSETETLGGHREELAGVLRDRSSRLDSEKKALLRMILDRGASYEQVARLSGEHASTVSRRFRAMVRRLRGRPLHTAGNALRNLTPLDKTILIESFLYGTPQKEIAAKLSISRYRVRKALRPFRGSGQKREGASPPI
jgi:DNA-directed RNA polymerase specialized sigma24 family protein